MSWEQVTTWLDAFTNKPIVIAIVSILTAAAPLILIFKNTSFGKKAIASLTSLYRLGEEKANATLKKVEDVEKLAKEKIDALEREYTQKLEDFQNKCEQKVACAISIVNFYEESLFALIEQIPNKKVQTLLLDFKDKYQEKKWEISQIVDITYQDYNEHIDLVKHEVREEYNEKIEFLENQIAQLKLYFDEVKGEPNDGEREETTNSNPEEETLQDSIESL